MSEVAFAGLAAEIATYCREMKLATVARVLESHAADVRRANADALVLVRSLLAAEHDERARKRTLRRLKEARFPLVKSLESFDFRRNPTLDEAKIRELVELEFVGTGRPVLLLGGTGTGKTHLATALGFAACARGISVRFITTAALVNELTEAADSRALSRVVGRYARVELLVLDELGYVPLSPSASQLLFQVVAERGERRSTVVTTNLPFGEWTTIISDPRLCRAFVERMTYRAHIIETGDQSVRLEEMLTLARKARKDTRREAPEVPA